MLDKKIIFILGAVLIIGLFSFLKTDNNILYKSINNKDGDITSKILIKKISEDDKDGDGLKDWEEVLWKTNPNNPDTDGDGLNDNDEILQNRDPLKKGPDDFIKNLSTDISKNNLEIEDLKETDIVARELLVGYLGLKQANLLDQEHQEALVSSIINNKFKEDIVKQYLIEDLNIIYENDIESLSLYGNELVNIFKKYSDKTENDLIVVKRIIDKKNNEDIEKLKRSIEVYNRMKNEILNLKVPNEIILNHLNILNAINGIINDIEGMIYVLEDPIKALISINNYVTNENIVIEEFGKIVIYLKTKEVIINF